MNFKDISAPLPDVQWVPQVGVLDDEARERQPGAVSLALPIDRILGLFHACLSYSGGCQMHPLSSHDWCRVMQVVR